MDCRLVRTLVYKPGVGIRETVWVGVWFGKSNSVEVDFSSRPSRVVAASRCTEFWMAAVVAASGSHRPRFPPSSCLLLPQNRTLLPEPATQRVSSPFHPPPSTHAAPSYPALLITTTTVTPSHRRPSHHSPRHRPTKRPAKRPAPETCHDINTELPNDPTPPCDYHPCDYHPDSALRKHSTSASTKYISLRGREMGKRARRRREIGKSRAYIPVAIWGIWARTFGRLLQMRGVGG